MSKIIHYCWFGKGKKPEVFDKCIQSWKHFMPDWKIIEWNEDNTDLFCCSFVEEAYKCKKWAYFKRYVEPVALFLPINLVSMWSSVLSLTLRLFGNALAGYCVITLIYVGFGTLIPPEGNLAGLAITPVIAPFAHLYFDIFDALIQLAVFTMLTMINISGEYISPQDLEIAKFEKARYKEEKALRKKQKKLRKQGTN